MANNDIVTATVSKHCRRDLTRERPRLVFGHILGAQRHSAACQLAGDRAQVRIWRTNQQAHPLRARRTGNDTRDELGVAVTAYSPLGSPDSAAFIGREDDGRQMIKIHGALQMLSGWLEGGTNRPAAAAHSPAERRASGPW